LSSYPPEQGPLVRPYAMTGGRTRPDYELALEALVSTTRLGERVSESTAPERQVICDLCRRARSVAEIAAYVRMPLGVARVLVGDMAQEGLVRVHQTAAAPDRPDLALMQRVLNGLRNL
jgi:Protein of unknown function (DUF742)